MDLLNPARLDKKSVKKFFNRAANSYDQAAILQNEVQNRLLERLDYIRHTPNTVIDIGCGTGKGLDRLQRRYRKARVYGSDLAFDMLLRSRARQGWFSRRPLVAADMEHLPFANGAFDMVYSSLALQWSNQLPDTLRELIRISRAGALLLFATLGPLTLRELAESWHSLDSHPHVHRFFDMHDIGDMMLATGFNQPVVDAEVIRMEYPDFRSLLDDLKNIGATNADVGRHRGLMTPRQLRALEQRYREVGFENGKYVATYEVVYGHAWAK